MNERQQKFINGYDFTRKDCNIFGLIQTIHKMKACIEVLLDKEP